MRLMYVVSGKREAVQALDRLNALCDASLGAKDSTCLSLIHISHETSSAVTRAGGIHAFLTEPQHTSSTFA